MGMNFFTDKCGLTEEELDTLNVTRFSNNVPLSIRNKVQKVLSPLDCINCPIPTEKQIEAYFMYVNGLKNDITYFAGFLEQGLGKSKLACMIAKYLYHNNIINGVVIISPNDLKRQWVEEQWPLHFGKVTSLIWEGMNTQKERYDFFNFVDNTKGLRVFSTNVESFSRTNIFSYMKMFCQSCKDVLVIVDESTYIKNGGRAPKTNRSKRRGSKRTNTILDKFRNRRYKVILSGTAAPNKPFDLWSQFEFLNYNYFGLDYWDFCKRFGEMIQVKRSNAKFKSLELLDQKTFDLVKSDIKKYIGTQENRCNAVCPHLRCIGETCDKYKHVKDMPKLTFEIAEIIALNRGLTESTVKRIDSMEKLEPYKNLKDLKKKMSNVTFFCKTAECIDMPPRIYKVRECSMTKEQRRVYNDMERNMVAEFEGDTTSTLFKSIRYMRCQQITGGLFPYPVEVCKRLRSGEETTKIEYRAKRFKKNPKLELLSSILDEINDDRPKIYWARFIEEQYMIYDMLVGKYGKDNVGLYRTEKANAEKKFKDGKIQHFVGSDSASHGLNLQISGDQFFYSNDERGDTRDQKEARSYRLGRVGTCIFTDLIMLNSKDRKILDVLKMKLDLIDYFRSGKDD